MLLIFIFAHFLARFLARFFALAHTRVFLLTQRFLLSYILMKIFLFVDLRLQWLPRLSLASALALLSIVIRFPSRLPWHEADALRLLPSCGFCPSRLPWREADALRGSACFIRSSRLLWSFRLPSDCLDVCLGAKRTLFAFFPLAAFVPRVCLGAKRTLFAAPLSFWPKTKNSVFDLKQLRFLRPKPSLRYFAHRSMLLTKADIEGLSLRSVWSFALHYFTSSRFARLGLSPYTILQALASLGLFKLGCGSANANKFAFALALH